MTAGTAGPGAASGPLALEELARIDAYWRGANYLSVGQIFLLANPLLAEPLRPEHVKPRLLGHWGTTPGLNLIYAHMNRVITNWDLHAIYVIGPGHGGPGIVANAYLEFHSPVAGRAGEHLQTSHLSGGRRPPVTLPAGHHHVSA